MHCLGVAVVVLVVVGMMEAVTEGEAGKTDTKSLDGGGKEGSLSPEDSTERDRFFLGGHSTTTDVIVSMVTSTVFFSCIEGTSTALCMGRRNKRLSRISFGGIEGSVSHSALEGSKQDTTRETRELKDLLEEDSSDASSKLLGFTVWTRQRTTSTVTMLYTDTNTTIRLSYYCQAGNLQLPQFPCQPTAP